MVHEGLSVVTCVYLTTLGQLGQKKEHDRLPVEFMALRPIKPKGTLCLHTTTVPCDPFNASIG